MVAAVGEGWPGGTLDPSDRVVGGAGGHPDRPVDVSPRVLVVTPTRGTRQDLLAESDAGLRQQDVRFRRVLVAPDSAGPFGADAEVARDPGRGLSAAFNAGLVRQRGEPYVYWLNDDDRVLPGGLDHLVALLDATPSAPAAVASVDLIDGDGRRILTLGAGAVTVGLLPWGPGMMASPGVLYRATALRAAGGLDETLKHAADLDLLLRLGQVGRLVASGHPVGEFRWHAGSMTVDGAVASLREAEEVRRRFHSGRSKVAHIAYMVWRPVARMLTRTAKELVGARAAVRVDREGHGGRE